MKKLDREQAENMLEDWTEWMIETDGREPYSSEERGAELLIGWLYGHGYYVTEKEAENGKGKD